jgi:DNA-binding transcriptional MerR regulator
VRYSYAFRHKDPVQCIVGSIALYLFLRFDVGRESWPDFGNRNFGWHSIKLIRNKTDPTVALGYSAQLKKVKETFQQFGIHADGFTHAGRKAAVQHGEIIGVDDAQIRQFGHWDDSRLIKHYSAGVARPAARQFAGFPADRGNYYLPRSILPPSESLRKKVFPRVEESLQIIESFPPEAQDKAAGAVLRTFDWFRTVVLEDAAVLQLDPRFRDSPLWKCELFNDPEFLQYQLNVQQTVHEDTIPVAIQIRQLVPDIARELHSVTESVLGQLSAVSKNVNRVEDRVITIINNQKSHDERFIAIEKFADRMNRGQIKIVSYLQTDIDDIDLNSNNIQNDSDHHQESLVISSSIAQLQILSPSSSSITRQNPEDLPSIAEMSEVVPNYMINISITTVDAAWEEWDRGLISGPDGLRSPSIQYLEKEFGAKWRKTDASRQRYTRRKALIQRIMRAAKSLGLPESDIAHRMDVWRRARGMTLDKIQKTLQSYRDGPEPWGPNDTELLHIH